MTGSADPWRSTRTPRPRGSAGRPAGSADARSPSIPPRAGMVSRASWWQPASASRKTAERRYSRSAPLMTTTPAIPPSYDHGAGDRPLLGETIGENFNQIATAHAHREALADLSTGRRWTYAELAGRSSRSRPGRLPAGPAAAARAHPADHHDHRTHRGKHQTPAPAAAQQQNRRSTSPNDWPAPSQRVHGESRRPGAEGGELLLRISLPGLPILCARLRLGR